MATIIIIIITGAASGPEKGVEGAAMFFPIAFNFSHSPQETDTAIPISHMK